MIAAQPSARAMAGPSVLRLAVAAVRREVGAVLVFSMVANLLMLTVPIFTLQVYDRVLNSRSESTLLVLLLLALFLLAVMAIIDGIRALLLGRIAAAVTRQIEPQLLRAVFSATARNPDAGAGSALRDLDTVRQFISSQAPIAFFDTPWVPVFTALVIVMHPWLGAVAVMGALVIGGLAVVTELVARRPLEQTRADAQAAQRFAMGTIRNTEAALAMGMVDRITRQWQSQRAVSLATGLIAGDRVAMLTAVSKALRLTLQVALLTVGASLAINREITPGTIIASAIIMSRALAPVEQALSSWRGFTAARAAWGRLGQLFAAIPSAADRLPLPAPAGRLDLEAVTAGPPIGAGPPRAVVRNVSVSLDPGDSLAILGPSGSGKSTLARTIVSAWPALAGTVRLDGADIGRLDPAAVGRYIGYLPQDVELFNGTVAENIARFLPPAEHAEAIVAAATDAGAHEMILRLPDGYDTSVGRGGHVLSAGQRQRIALARALFGRPVLVVLDEPNANLDAEGDMALLTAIRTMAARGQTLVLVTQRPNVLSAVDRIILLKDGVVDADGSREDLLPRLVRAPPSPAPVPAAPVPRGSTG